MRRLSLIHILGEGIPFVRVDLYLADGKIYFGEMTFTPDVYKRQALGKSGPKARSKDVTDGQQVEIPVP